MKWLTATLCLVAIALCTGDAMAERCSGISPVVFCDDFDRWCEEPPVDPDAACPLGSPADNDAFRAHWPQSDGICSFDVPYSLWTEPDVHYEYASVMATQDPDNQRLARHVHDMTPEILDNPLNTEDYGAIDGSGEILSSTHPSYVDPDTISTVLKGHAYIHNGNLDGGGTLRCGAYYNFTYYTELNLDGDRAPTNFIWRNCYAEVHDHGGSPHQLMATTDENPDPGTDWHHASFAFGLVAHFDEPDNPNPCNLGAGRKPSAYRAFFYDGSHWRRLKGSEIPDLPTPDIADFYPWKEWNRLRFFIGTDYIELRLYNARAEEIHRSEGVCGFEGCNVKRCFGGLDHWSDLDCRTEITCRPSQGTCVSGSCTDIGYCDLDLEECVGGLYAGEAHACTTDDDCPDSCERGLNEGEECDTDDDCTALACWGGTNHGNTCSIDDDCPSAPPTIPQPYFVARVPRVYKGPFNTIALGAGKGVDQMTPKCEQIRHGEDEVCVGGIENGNLCTTAADCPPSVGTCDSGFCDGGTNDEGACTQTCPDGVCNAQGRCDGGANADQPCDCPAFEECLKPVSTWNMNMAVDEVVLWDGEFKPLPGVQGACCRTDGTCDDGVEADACTGHDVWRSGESCGETLCCPRPWADADNDGDVDQVDFGVWQACFTGSTESGGGGVSTECECYDRNDSTGAQKDTPPYDDVDTTDFTWFGNCFTGPTMPMDLDYPPENCTP